MSAAKQEVPFQELSMIRRYQDSDGRSVIDLVLRIQNEEFNLGLGLSEQPDLLQIRGKYEEQGGAFWVAEDDGVIVGCIGLMLIDNGFGALKKFFVHRNYRGRERGISSMLFSELVSFASARCFKAVVLDTPSVATRSHAFYQRAGFRPISRQDLPVKYEYPDRDSILFMLEFKDRSATE